MFQRTASSGSGPEEVQRDKRADFAWSETGGLARSLGGSIVVVNSGKQMLAKFAHKIDTVVYSSRGVEDETARAVSRIGFSSL